MSLSPTALITLLQAKQFIRLEAASSLHIDMENVGTGNGSNKAFALDYAPIEGSLKLYVDFALKVENTDFTITGASITFIAAPANGKLVTASYDQAASSNTFEDYDDRLLEQLIDTATKKAEDYTERAFIQRGITEQHIGDGGRVLKLNKQPILEIDSVKINGEEITDYTARLAIGRLYRSRWNLEDEIEIVYTAGHGGEDADQEEVQLSVPDAVLAVKIAVANWYNNRLGLRSENISGVGSADYGEAGELPDISLKLLTKLRVNILC